MKIESIPGSDKESILEWKKNLQIRVEVEKIGGEREQEKGKGRVFDLKQN